MDWIATAFTLVALWLTASAEARTRAWGFVAGALGNLAWGAWALLCANFVLWPLVFVNLPILALNLRGAWKNLPR